MVDPFLPIYKVIFNFSLFCTATIPRIIFKPANSNKMVTVTITYHPKHSLRHNSPGFLLHNKKISREGRHFLLPLSPGYFPSLLQLHVRRKNQKQTIIRPIIIIKSKLKNVSKTPTNIMRRPAHIRLGILITASSFPEMSS